MRTFLVTAGVLLAVSAGLSASARAGEGCQSCQASHEDGCGQCGSNDCDKDHCDFWQNCCLKKCHCCCCSRLFERDQQFASVDAVNCNCNGSYKFPVPPLYTYHWPGRFSQQLMTDYQSPWRFPPLKPYTDEAPGRAASLVGEAQTASAVMDVAPAKKLSSDGTEPMSIKIARLYANP